MTTEEFARRNAIPVSLARTALRWAARSGYAVEVEPDVWRPSAALERSELGDAIRFLAGRSDADADATPRAA